MEIIVSSVNTDHINDILLIAEKTWKDTYKNIISKEQIDFMYDKMYSKASLNLQFDMGHQFAIAYSKELPVGFISFYIQENKIYIPKLYVSKAYQGQGIGCKLLKYIFDFGKSEKIETVQLNVNRNNKAVNFYQKIGFEIIESTDIAYYQYWLNDYIMQKKL